MLPLSCSGVVGLCENPNCTVVHTEYIMLVDPDPPHVIGWIRSQEGKNYQQK
jgi:hypothetical protein